MRSRTCTKPKVVAAKVRHISMVRKAQKSGRSDVVDVAWPKGRMRKAVFHSTSLLLPRHHHPSTYHTIHFMLNNTVSSRKGCLASNIFHGYLHPQDPPFFLPRRVLFAPYDPFFRLRQPFSSHLNCTLSSAVPSMNSDAGYSWSSLGYSWK